MVYEQWFTELVDPKKGEFREWIFEIDTGAMEVRIFNESNSPEHLVRTARANSIEELQEVYSAIFEEIEADAHQIFDDFDEGPEPMDLQAIIDGDKKRQAKVEAREGTTRRPSQWASIEERIESLIREANLSGDALARVAEEYDLDVTAKSLIDSFHYVIEIDQKYSLDREVVSKREGTPDLPQGVEPPGKPYHFLCQIDFAELAPFDLHVCMPEQGVVFFFVADGKVDVKAIYAEEVGPRHDDGKTLRFSPNFYFDQGSDTGAPAELHEALPDELTSAISTAIGLETPRASVYLNSDKFFGGEMDWQGMGGSLNEPLFLMLDYADGTLHIGIDDDDLYHADFEDIETVYSGT